MSAPSSFAPPRLELRGISKRYPGCLANDRIDLCIDAGEIHALLGENGAGKSTLMKIIYGVTRPDAGEVRWQGEPVQVRDPARARALGIGMVFQHFSLFETLSVAENIALALGAEAGSPRRLEARIREVSQRYGMPLEPRRLVHGLSIGERQRVEIVRCLMQDIRLLILDEPTSVLTPREAEDLFVTLRRLAEEGCSVLFISHKLAEVRALCQRATVLRGGRVAGQCVPAQCSDLELARLMVGDAEGLAAEYPKVTGGAPFLQVRDLHWRNPDPFGVSFAGLDLEVRSGEILGIAGVAGNGQDELLALLSGEVRLPRAQAERIRLGGCAGAHLAPDARRRAGQAFVPAERLGHGAVPEMSLADNALLTAFQQGLVKRGLVRRRKVLALAEEIIRRFAVKAPGAGRRHAAFPAATCRSSFSAARSSRPRACWWRRIPPGRGRRRGGADPPRADRLARCRYGDPGGLRGPRRAVPAQRPHRRAVFGSAVPGGRHRERFAAAGRRLDGRSIRGAGGSRRRRCPREPVMLLSLEPRGRQSRWMLLASPLLAGLLTLVCGALLFACLGHDPWQTLHTVLVQPLSDLYGLGELLVKAMPILLCALGLALAYQARVWNIGAEGQLLVGALAGSAVAIQLLDWQSRWALAWVLLAGTAAGALWAGFAAWLRTRFNANEILTTIMLNYIALNLLLYGVHGPLKDPDGFNFPQSALFGEASRLPALFEDSRVHLGALFGLLALAAVWVLAQRSFLGFQVRVLGLDRRAAGFVGFREKRLVWFVLLFSGALAGLAGVCEVAGPIGQLVPQVSPGYGYAAITVAFLGRLNPFGILCASLLMALLYLGGEAAQMSLNLPLALTGLFQGMMLFFLLACDVLILYRPRLHGRWRKRPALRDALA